MALYSASLALVSRLGAPRMWAVDPADDDLGGRAEPSEARAERLKVRVYITFTALATVLALRAGEQSAHAVAILLVIVVFGTLLAVFVADVVSHIVVHATLPDRRQLRHMAKVSFGALGAVVLPFVFRGLAVVDVWSADAALELPRSHW
jgi:fatty acid desaturase